MHRPHFRIKGGHHPPAFNDWKSFEEISSLSTQNDAYVNRPSTALPSVEDLRRMMHNEPEVRQVLLNEIRQKLARGDFLTRKADNESAGRLLDSGDLFLPMR